jgi:isopenicillin N synthase-like dioxygenase
VLASPISPFLGRSETWISPSHLDAAVLNAVFDAAHEFFLLPNPVKESLRAVDTMTGWRDIGVEYSQTPDRPDLNETFCYRAADERPGLPESNLLGVCRAAHPILDRLAGEALDVLAESCASTDRLRIRTWSESWIQVNFSRPESASRSFIQDPHEDGHLVTLLMADAEGLEIVGPDARWKAILPRPERIVCFAGECGALLTGDAVAPMPHQVRVNRDVPVRISVAYFVNPDLDQDLAPWVPTPRNAGVDLLRWGQQNPTRFGLPAL